MGCILCEKPKQKKDLSNLILARGKQCFVMMNLYPYNNGHLMISPYQHVDTLEELSDAALKDLMRFMKKSIAALRKSFKPEGINVGLNLGKAAGAGIDDHLHFHVVPRWMGDTNFMTVISEVRVIPEDLEETYRQLKPYFK
ncbi:MAG TPA: HIT domain-containing protein [Candidatus Manganitrophaceae bacterium]|nr:HIT domain-containing protein [Candidatus Manganitrophaceae bacterium]